MQEINSTITIHAPKQLVWQILIDLESYHKWNPFTPKVVSTLKPGDEVALHVNMNPGKKLLIQKETILWNKPTDSIAWGITASFPVRTERAQLLTAVDENTTTYHTYDKFWGILVPIVMLFYRKKVQHGFDSVAKGLKAYAEAQYQLTTATNH